MITDAESSLPNDPPTGCLVTIFTIRINQKVFSLGCTLHTRKVPTPILGIV